MAKSTRQHVFEGMELLPEGLIPFVELSGTDVRTHRIVFALLLVTPATSDGAWRWDDLVGALDEAGFVLALLPIEILHGTADFGARKVVREIDAVNLTSAFAVGPAYVPSGSHSVLLM